MLFQVLWQDIKGVVPEKYLQKHMADWMRETMFTEELDGSQVKFKVLCKVAADFSPRELTKLKARFIKAMDRLRSGNLDVNNLYAKFMAGTYSKQVNGQKFGQRTEMQVQTVTCPGSRFRHERPRGVSSRKESSGLDSPSDLDNSLRR